MKEPTTSRFMGLTYGIEYLEVVGEGDRWGETDHNNRRLSIEHGLPHDHMREVVLHETFHQIAGTAEVGLDPEVEEKVATFFSRALIGHMRDNPTYWRWLLQKPPKDSTDEPPIDPGGIPG